VSVVGIVCLFVCLFAVVVGDSVQLVAGLLLLLLPLPCLGVVFVLGGFWTFMVPFFSVVAGDKHLERGFERSG
jgi:hypothetical protein